MFNSEPELAAYLEKREQRLYSRLLLNRVFQGIVSAVIGTAPPYLIQVVRSGESVSDGHTYPVTLGWDPVVGDTCNIIWKDDSIGLAAFPSSNGALSRLPPRHPYRARIYWTGSYTTFAGYNLIGYNNVSSDLSGLAGSGSQLGAFVVKVPGTYRITVQTAAAGVGDMTSAIYINNVGPRSQGDRPPGGGLASNVSDEWDLVAGDQVNGAIYTGTPQALSSGAYLNYMTISLVSR